MSLVGGLLKCSSTQEPDQSSKGGAGQSGLISSLCVCTKKVGNYQQTVQLPPPHVSEHLIHKDANRLVVGQWLPRTGVGPKTQALEHELQPPTPQHPLTDVCREKADEYIRIHGKPFEQLMKLYYHLFFNAS